MKFDELFKPKPGSIAAQMQKTIDELNQEIKRLKSEVKEQAVLNGKGSEREARLLAENAELRAKLNDPARLHAHCVRYLTDAQVAHLFGERMTEIVNSRDKLERENAALRADNKKASERLRYLAQFWNPNFNFESDEIGKWVVIGDYDQMIKAIDQGIKDINAARREAQL